jgi:poly(3-hydroxybutyrate) depolymerase
LRIFRLSALLLVLAVAAARLAAAEPLPKLAADTTNVTVSGVSSGAYMAVQFQVAHSRMVRGIAAIAGGPYYCAQGSVWTAFYNCMTPTFFMPIPSTSVLKAETDALAQRGAIDPTSNLAGTLVWLFSGTKDHTVDASVVRALQAYYVGFKASPILVADKPAGHAMVTEDQGNACGTTDTPFINNCHYDAAGKLLIYLVGAAQPAGSPAGRVIRFDQNEFANGDASALSMAAEGFAYVPKACGNGGCGIHVAFHGCRQDAAEVGERFVRDAGYNRWADTNGLIVLYPQTIARYYPLFNPRACWDWWGYTGPLYHTKNGAQIRAVTAMIGRLGAK